MISDTQRATLIGRPGQIIADIRAYEAVGVTHLTCDLPATSADQALEFLERPGAEVLPQVR
jgi:hypothetical protein